MKKYQAPVLEVVNLQTEGAIFETSPDPIVPQLYTGDDPGVGVDADQLARRNVWSSEWWSPSKD